MLFLRVKVVTREINCASEKVEQNSVATQTDSFFFGNEW